MICRLAFKTHKVKLVSVHHIEGLTVKVILDFAKRRSDIDQYLPIYKKGKYSNSQFFCNLGKITCLMIILKMNSFLPHDFYVLLQKKSKKGKKK